MPFNKAKTGRLAISLERQLAPLELRAYCDQWTGYSLSAKQLSKVVEWVEGNPVYLSLPEEKTPL